MSIIVSPLGTAGNPSEQPDFGLYDIAAAQRCLDTLGGPNASFTIQTFLDSEREKGRLDELEKLDGQRELSPAEVAEYQALDQHRRDCIRQFHGPFRDLAPQLQRLNEAGAGVFVTINETNGRGRKKEDVVALRALFIDGDDIPMPKTWPLPPNIVVVRGDRHWHAYWLLKAGESLDQFTAAQKQLATFFMSDPKICDLSRVMRLPGFAHRKGEPIPVRLARCEAGVRYGIADVLDAHPVAVQVVNPTPDASLPMARSDAAMRMTTADPYMVARARAYLMECPPSIAGQHGHDALLWATRALLIGFCLPTDAARAILVHDFNPRCKPPWPAADIEHKLRQAETTPFDKPRGWLLVETSTLTVPHSSMVDSAVASDCCDLATLLDHHELLNPPPRIPTTYPALDQALDGGMVVGGVYVIAGQTSRMKSTLLTNMARRMGMSGTRVLMLSLEDDRYATVRRMIAQLSKVSVKALENFNKPDALVDAERPRVEAALAALRGLQVRIDTTTTRMNQLEKLVEQEAKAGAKVVILDQSSWVEVDRSETLFQEASEISRRLALLARRVGVVLIVAVQVNRMGATAKSQGQPLELYHLRDSGRWEQDAAGVLIIQDVTKVEHDYATMRLDVKKHRHGPRDLTSELLALPRCALIEEQVGAVAIPIAPVPQGAKKNKAGKLTVDQFVDRYVNGTPLTRDAIKYHAGKLGLTVNAVSEMLKQAEAVGMVARAGTDEKGKPLFVRRTTKGGEGG